jgi:hypothetical protein
MSKSIEKVDKESVEDEHDNDNAGGDEDVNDDDDEDVLVSSSEKQERDNNDILKELRAMDREAFQFPNKSFHSFVWKVSLFIICLLCVIRAAVNAYIQTCISFVPRFSNCTTTSNTDSSPSVRFVTSSSCDLAVVHPVCCLTSGYTIRIAGNNRQRQISMEMIQSISLSYDDE